MHSFSFRTAVRHGLAVSALLTLGALTACGGSSSHSSVTEGSEDRLLVLTDDNAPAVVQMSSATADMAPELLFLFIMYGFENGNLGCLNEPEGSSDLETDGNRPLRVAFNDCQVEDYSDLDSRLNGSLEFVFDTPSPDSPFLLTMTGYEMKSIDTLNGYHEETLRGNGQVKVTPSANILISSLNDFNGELFISRVEGVGDDREESVFRWTFRDYQLGATEGTLGPEYVTLDGHLGFGAPLNGEVALTTHVPLHYENGPGDGCPSAGDITANGGEGTSVNLLFASDDEILVTLNGVTETFNCQDFQNWLNATPVPFSARIGR
ncbi:MAG: hypothetical protein ABJQ98_13780 [Alloalcanivorax venustensis]|jgi:hypothetical protein|uniref:hypothetical protein n=1 Tax=Alloalcanivorax venustensis TaxID=172371 RepID=UPI003299605E